MHHTFVVHIFPRYLGKRAVLVLLGGACRRMTVWLARGHRESPGLASGLPACGSCTWLLCLLFWLSRGSQAFWLTPCSILSLIAFYPVLTLLEVSLPVRQILTLPGLLMSNSWLGQLAKPVAVVGGSSAIRGKSVRRKMIASMPVRSKGISASSWSLSLPRASSWQRVASV